jgi:hypothetical protein
MNDGQAGKDDGMRRAEEHANAAWRTAAYLAIYRAASELAYFTSDDVMTRIMSNAWTHELRALGPLMRKAAIHGWIEKAPVPARNSVRASLHCSPRTVWKSMIYKES